MKIQDEVPQTVLAVADFLMVATMIVIVDDDSPIETITIEVSLARMTKNFDQEGNMMTGAIVEEEEAKIEKGILLTRAENRRRTMNPSQLEMTIERKTAQRVPKMKWTKTKMNAGGVEARIGANEGGREKDLEIRVETRIKRKGTGAATAKMMTGAIVKKRIEMIRSLKETKMIRVVENESVRKIQTETVVENVKNVADMTRILVVVTRPVVTIVQKNARREVKEGAMAGEVIGIDLLRHQEGNTISMEILWLQIKIVGVKEVEINAMIRAMVDMDLALKTGDLR